MAQTITKVITEKTLDGITARLEARAVILEQSVQENCSCIRVDTYFCATNNTSSSKTVYFNFEAAYASEQLCYFNTSNVPISVDGVLGTYPCSYMNNSKFATYTHSNYGIKELSLEPGASGEIKVFSVGYEDKYDEWAYHNVDGTLQIMLTSHLNGSECYAYYKKTNTNWQYFFDDYRIECAIDIPTIDRAVIPITADNFNDEGNPSFSYEITTGTSIGYYMYDGAEEPTAYVRNSDTIEDDTVTALQVALSFDGETIDIPYREVPLDKTSYTFELTDAEREILRQKAQGAPTVPIYYMTKVTREVNTSYGSNPLSEYHATADFVGKLQRNFTVVGCNPSLNSDVWDIKEETLALTGDKDTVIRYESMVEFAVRATASKNATIVSQSVTCGSKTVDGLEYGVIDDVESGAFIFKATDSRNLTAEKTVQKNLIEYVKPTCYQKLSMEMSGEFDTRVVVKVNGNYYNGSFGAVDNTLLLEVRYTNNDGVMGDWQVINDTPTFNGNTYSVETKIEGFSYSKAYVFQCRATDKLNYVQSAQYTLRIYPVFDWGENDFNFNVPVKMNGETVLRHNADANNTVLSASGGHIYIRPGGSESTSGELMIKPDGDVLFGGEVEVNSAATFNGDVNLNGTVKVDGVDLNEILYPEEEEEAPAPADYIVATGTTPMGTNGVWYWTKWYSGKAECYGKRNFGSMAITTKKTDDVYRSATLTQDLPSSLFMEAPEVIDISTYPNGESNYLYTWIGAVSSTAASASSTGGFCVMSCNSQTASSSYITFHIIGKWREMYATNTAWSYYHADDCSSMMDTGLEYTLMTEDEAVAAGYKKHSCIS